MSRILLPDRRIVLPPGRHRSAAWRRIRAGRTAFSLWDLGGCNCTACSQTFTVKGCNGGLLTGITVSVYDSSGTVLLTSGTTNGSGQVTLSWSGTGSVVVTTSSTRLVAPRSLSLTCGGSITLTLTPASGYTCALTGSCVQPWKTTLTATITGITGISTVTMTNSGGFGGTWSGSANGSGYTWTFTFNDLYHTFTISASGGGPVCTTTPSVTCPLSFLMTASCTPSGWGSLVSASATE